MAGLIERILHLPRKILARLRKVKIDTVSEAPTVMEGSQSEGTRHIPSNPVDHIIPIIPSANARSLPEKDRQQAKFEHNTVRNPLPLTHTANAAILSQNPAVESKLENNDDIPDLGRVLGIDDNDDDVYVPSHEDAGIIPLPEGSPPRQLPDLHQQIEQARQEMMRALAKNKEACHIYETAMKHPQYFAVQHALNTWMQIDMECTHAINRYNALVQQAGILPTPPRPR